MSDDTDLDFNLNDEQQALRALVREFAEAEVAPAAEEHDDAGTVPVELFPKIAELGLWGILIPEELGGAGLGYVEYTTILQELARVDPSTALTVAAHNSLGSGHIYQNGNDGQRARWMPELASGRTLAAWALTEPSSGSDAAGLKTVATTSLRAASRMGAKRLTRGVNPWLLLADVAQWTTEVGGHHVGLSDPKQRRMASRAIGGLATLGLGALGGPVAAAVAGSIWVAGELAGEASRVAYDQVRVRAVGDKEFTSDS